MRNPRIAPLRRLSAIAVPAVIAHVADAVSAGLLPDDPIAFVVGPGDAPLWPAIAPRGAMHLPA